MSEDTRDTPAPDVGAAYAELRALVVARLGEEFADLQESTLKAFAAFVARIDRGGAGGWKPGGRARWLEVIVESLAMAPAIAGGGPGYEQVRARPPRVPAL
jgi:hypothetical protein